MAGRTAVYRRRAEPRTVPREEAEARALYTWVDLHWFSPWFFHVPNERSGAIERAILSGLGVRPGVPDCWLMLPSAGYHGLALELKRRRGGRVSAHQQAWIARLGAVGYQAVVAYGWEDAAAHIEAYAREARPPSL